MFPKTNLGTTLFGLLGANTIYKQLIILKTFSLLLIIRFLFPNLSTNRLILMLYSKLNLKYILSFSLLIKFAAPRQYIFNLYIIYMKGFPTILNFLPLYKAWPAELLVITNMYYTYGFSLILNIFHSLFIKHILLIISALLCYNFHIIIFIKLKLYFVLFIHV